MLKKRITIVALAAALLLGFLPVYSMTYENIDYRVQDLIHRDVASAEISRTVPEKLRENLKKPVTVGEYAELKYSFNPEMWYPDLIEKTNIKDGRINASSPIYEKIAFLSGLVSDGAELSKTMTREEAAIRLMRMNSNLYNDACNVRTADYMTISPDALEAVGEAIEAKYIAVINNRFEPQKPFTVEQAIADE